MRKKALLKFFTTAFMLSGCFVGLNKLSSTFAMDFAGNSNAMVNSDLDFKSSSSSTSSSNENLSTNLNDENLKQLEMLKSKKGDLREDFDIMMQNLYIKFEDEDYSRCLTEVERLFEMFKKAEVLQNKIDNIEKKEGAANADFNLKLNEGSSSTSSSNENLSTNSSSAGSVDDVSNIKKEEAANADFNLNSNVGSSSMSSFNENLSTNSSSAGSVDDVSNIEDEGFNSKDSDEIKIDGNEFLEKLLRGFNDSEETKINRRKLLEKLLKGYYVGNVKVEFEPWEIENIMSHRDIDGLQKEELPKLKTMAHLDKRFMDCYKTMVDQLKKEDYEGLLNTSKRLKQVFRETDDLGKPIKEALNLSFRFTRCISYVGLTKLVIARYLNRLFDRSDVKKLFGGSFLDNSVPLGNRKFTDREKKCIDEVLFDFASISDAGLLSGYNLELLSVSDREDS